jgi:hypothetical protein
MGPGMTLEAFVTTIANLAGLEQPEDTRMLERDAVLSVLARRGWAG